VNADNKQNNKLERLGFSFERGGVHTARTMMLGELRALLSYVNNAEAAKTEYLKAIQTANCLGKRSGKTRALTFRHLADLYALDPSILVFRALRFFWQRDGDGQPLLAALRAAMEAAAPGMKIAAMKAQRRLLQPSLSTNFLPSPRPFDPRREGDVCGSLRWL